MSIYAQEAPTAAQKLSVFDLPFAHIHEFGPTMIAAEEFKVTPIEEQISQEGNPYTSFDVTWIYKPVILNEDGEPLMRQSQQNQKWYPQTLWIKGKQRYFPGRSEENLAAFNDNYARLVPYTILPKVALFFDACENDSYYSKAKNLPNYGLKLTPSIYLTVISEHPDIALAQFERYCTYIDEQARAKVALEQQAAAGIEPLSDLGDPGEVGEGEPEYGF